MRRAPAGATELSWRDFRSPGRGSDSIFTTNRWFAPPANIQCPFGTARSLSSANSRYAMRSRRFEVEDFAKTDMRPEVASRHPALSASRGQLEEAAKVPGRLNTHDEVLQFFALILADDITAERGEFYRDFFFGHGVAWVTLRNIDTCGVRLAAIRRDRHPTRLELRKERFELLVGYHFHFVHDRNKRLVQDSLFLELQRRDHAVD